jgi:hypothetical protein
LAIPFLAHPVAGVLAFANVLGIGLLMAGVCANACDLSENYHQLIYFPEAVF